MVTMRGFRIISTLAILNILQISAENTGISDDTSFQVEPDMLPHIINCVCYGRMGQLHEFEEEDLEQMQPCITEGCLLSKWRDLCLDVSEDRGEALSRIEKCIRKDQILSMLL